MECSESVLEGHARVLDIAIDTIKDFVIKFNELIRSQFREVHGTQIEYISDITELRKDGDLLTIGWGVRQNGQLIEGTAVYDQSSSVISLK